jgi:hypothetical protein
MWKTFNPGNRSEEKVMNPTHDEILKKVRSGEWLLSVSLGMGRDSWAMLLEFKRLGITPDQIIFADTGAEKDATYRFKDEVAVPWIERAGFPALTTVRYWDYAKHGRYTTIQGNLVANETLASLAFGGSCSHSTKYKHAVMDWFRLNAWAHGVAAKASGKKIVCAIGYDDSEKDRKRRRRMDRALPNAKDKLVTLQAELADDPTNKKLKAKVSAKRRFIAKLEDGPFVYWYPLQAWKWDRVKLTREIEKSKLPVPPKSSCWLCPAMQAKELVWLAIHENANFLEALKIENVYRATMDIAEDGASGIRKRDGKVCKVMGHWGQSGRKIDGVRFRSWGAFATDRDLLNADTLATLRASGEYDSYPDTPTDDCFTCGD